MAQARQNIFTSRSHREAFDEYARLDKLFLATFKRSSKVELFFSSEGSFRDDEQYGITAYYLPEQKDELDFFIKNVKSFQNAE